MVPSKTPRQIAVSGNFCQKTLLFQWNIVLLWISSCPPLLWARSPQMPPKCLPDASQMPPRCFPDASKMPLRCLSDDSQMPSRSQMPLRCLPSLAPLLSPPWFYSIDLTLPWWEKTVLIWMMFSPPWFFFIDLSSMILQVGSEKHVWGLVLGSFIIFIQLY